MNASFMSAVAAVCLLPFWSVGNRSETGTVATYGSIAVLAFYMCMCAAVDMMNVFGTVMIMTFWYAVI